MENVTPKVNNRRLHSTLMKIKSAGLLLGTIKLGELKYTEEAFSRFIQYSSMLFEASNEIEVLIRDIAKLQQTKKEEVL